MQIASTSFFVSFLFLLLYLRLLLLLYDDNADRSRWIDRSHSSTLGCLHLGERLTPELPAALHYALIFLPSSFLPLSLHSLPRATIFLPPTCGSEAHDPAKTPQATPLGTVHLAIYPPPRLYLYLAGPRRPLLSHQSAIRVELVRLLCARPPCLLTLNPTESNRTGLDPASARSYYVIKSPVLALLIMPSLRRLSAWLLLLVSLCSLVESLALTRRDADFESVRTRLHKDHSGKAGDPKDKYFRKSCSRIRPSS